MSYIQVTTGTTGENLYAVFYSHETGWIWDNANSRWLDTSVATGSGNGGLDYDANWANVAVAMAEDTGSASDASGHYQLQLPTALAAIVESVDVVVRKRMTGSPLVTDPPVSAGTHVVVTHGAYLVSKTG